MTTSRTLRIGRLAASLVLLLAAEAAAKKPAAHKAKAKRPIHARSALVAPRPRMTARELVAPQPAPGQNVATASTDAERTLQRQLDAILDSKWLKSAVNGVYVVDAVTGQELYSYAADRQLNPASNTKLISTATAFEVLGPDFTYQTRLLGAQPVDGVVKGDVVLVGSGDPTLAARHLDDLAASLKDHGVTKIEGDLVISSDERDGLAHAYVSVTVSGGDKDGERPSVRLSPESGYFTIRNHATTGAVKKKRSSLSIGTLRLDGDGPQLAITVEGKIRRGQDIQALRPVPKPILYTGYTLRTAIEKAGVEVTGKVRQVDARPDPAEGAVELAVHDSVPLKKLAALINKPSNNYLADRLILTVGAQKYGGDTSMQKGVKAMGEFLDSIGVGAGTYRLENGSGLSHEIHVSPRQIAKVLLAGARDEKIGGDWLTSLAVGGVDGTLRGRFAGHPVAGYVRGKTGTLNGVSALSGFVTISEDRSVCFSVLTSGFGGKRKQHVREMQAAVADAIFDYLRTRMGDQPLPPPPATGTVPATAGEPDSEDQPASEESLGNPDVEL